MERKYLNSAQFFILVFVCGMAIKMFMLPALLLKVSGRESIVVVTFYLIVEVVCLLFLLLTLSRNPDKTLYQILEETLGKIISKIIIVYFSGLLLLKLLLMLSEVKVFFSVSIYERISWEIMIIPLLALCVGFATKPLTTIGRSAQIFMPLIVVSTIILSLLLSSNVPLFNILPLFSNGAQSTIEGIKTFPVWFGDVSLLLVCLGNVKTGKKFVLKAVATRVFSAVFVLAFSLIMFSTYADITDLIDYGHNVSSMTQYSLGSHDYGRFDYIIYCFWMLAVIVKIILNFYVLSQNFRYVSQKSSQFIIPLIVFVVVYALTTFVLNNENSVYQMATGIARIVFLPAEFLFPIFVFLLALVKYKRAEENKG